MTINKKPFWHIKLIKDTAKPIFYVTFVPATVFSIMNGISGVPK